MGKRGPPRTPSSIKRLRGTDQPCRMNPHEPSARPGVPDPPEFLDPEALDEWHRLMPELELRGLVEQIDMAVVAVYCSAWSQLCKAQGALAIEGHLLIDQRGAVVTSPWVKVATTARSQLIAACREMGLSPSSRATVKAGSPPVEPEREAAIRRYFGGVRGGR